MDSQLYPRHLKLILLTFGLIVVVLLACSRSINPTASPSRISGAGEIPAASYQGVNESSPDYEATQLPGAPVYTPTPDPPRVLPPLRLESETYVVAGGDTLGLIAQKYSTSLESLIAANELPNPNLLSVGQVLTIPPPEPGPTGTSFKIIPDSELVYGPASAGFDVAAFIRQQGGYLAGYQEEVEEASLTGAQIVERIAYQFSLNPRLLLAVLEYQSGWVTDPNPKEETIDFPMGLVYNGRKGLYRQLAWAANFLNRGYYLWRVNGVPAWVTAGGDVIPIDPSINAGTASVQHLMSLLYDRPEWDRTVGEDGIFVTYLSFFGSPYSRAVEPLLPPSLAQPLMQLPFEPGKTWSYTGGPHGGWDSGSAWAALDFAPPGEPRGCVTSDEWVVAVADGVVVRSGNGAVVQDLDGDGLEQTGWTVLYMHIETRDRVATGTFVRAGERIGHPSCEGGYSNGTHLHMARRYNGEWISADQDIPFVLDGWSSRGAGREYDGYLTRDGSSLEALNGRSPQNAIQR